MVKNKHGGGSKTTVNGLKFEQTTDLSTAIENHGKYTLKDGKIFSGENELGLVTQKHQMYKVILEPNHVKWEDEISKKILPDDVLYLYKKRVFCQAKKVFIIEKKYQEDNGSVDEKLQTCDFKLKTYKKLFRSITRKVEYIYVLSDWYKNEKYKDTLDYIVSKKCKYYFNEIPLEELGL
ncbi:MAG: hypothetical protein KKH01_02635 [Firmicutes bacterium]|nr:hypothetical protein [Bacillota bacterium]